MTRTSALFIRIAFSTVWVMIGFSQLATATNQYSTQAIYDACISSKTDDRAFCFGYLDSAALTWAHAGMHYYLVWGGADADARLICRKGLAIETSDLVLKFVKYVEAYPDEKTQLAIQVVFDLVL